MTKTYTSKKILALVLSLAMVLSLFSVTGMTAWADEITAINAEQFLNAVTSGGTVKLGDDFTLPLDTILKFEKPLTLDLNGHTLTVQKNRTECSFDICAAVTIKDSSSSGGGQLINPERGPYVIYIDQGGSLTLESGTLIFTSTVCYGVYAVKGPFTMTGGMIDSANESVCRRGAPVSISGGTIKGELRWDEGDLSITGGKFSFDPSQYLGSSYKATKNGEYWEVTHTHDDTDFTAWTSTNSLPPTADNYYLTADVTVNEWSVPQGTTKLCLDGHTLTLNNSHIVMNSGCALEIYDPENTGTVKAYAQRDGSLFWINGGALTLNGGTIDGYSKMAGIVSISANSSFTMTGGKITGIGYGRYDASAIRFTGSNSSFTMTGGEITGARTQQGVTYFANKNVTVNISGSAKITGNSLYRDGTVRNLSIPENVKINIDDKLEADALIAVSMTTPGVFTNSTDTSNNDLSKFVSDNPNYAVGKNSEGQLYLAEARTVTYDGNGATSGTVPTDSGSPYASGSTVTVLGNTGNLAKDGHAFSKWNTAANGSGTDYSADDTFAISENTTLYAQWDHVHSFTYSADGAVLTAECGNDGCALTDKKVSFTLTAPEKTEYNDGKSADATIDTDELAAFNAATGLSVSADDITYEGTDNNYAGTAAPTGAGKYKAKITVESKTASVEYEIKKADPTVHDVPTGLEAVCGTKLADVELTGGFAWVNPDDVIMAMGEMPYSATYTPEDTTNFNIVESIDIPVLGHGIHHEAVPATCTEKGTVEYWTDAQGVVAFSKDEVDSAYMLETIDAPALGHDWSEITYHWADDPADGCYGERHCLRDDCGLIERPGFGESGENVSVKVAKEATCEEDGLEVYTATFENPDFETQTKEVVIEKLGHRFINFLRWVWESFQKAVAWLFCDNDPDHLESVDVPSAVETVIEPTCEEEGYVYHVATIDVAGKIEKGYKFEYIEPLGHDWIASGWDWTLATEEEGRLDTPRAELLLICARDEDHEMTVTATVTKAETDTAIIYTATAEFEGETYTSELVFPKETPDVPTPDVPTPDVPTPDVPTPDVPTPDVPTPDVPTPDVPTPDVPTPDVPTPDEPTPDVPTPDVPTPDEPTPDVPTPDVPTPDVPTPIGLLGDVNGDGQVDSADALLILRNSVQLDEFDAVQRFLGDVNEDNENIDSSDALAVLRYSVGIIDIEKIGTPVSKTVA